MKPPLAICYCYCMCTAISIWALLLSWLPYYCCMIPCNSFPFLSFFFSFFFWIKKKNTTLEFFFFFKFFHFSDRVKRIVKNYSHDTMKPNNYSRITNSRVITMKRLYHMVVIEITKSKSFRPRFFRPKIISVVKYFH
jgi:hypothetical protein